MTSGKFEMARSGVRILCVAALCVGVAAVSLAAGETSQTEVYDGLANTAYSSSYMNRAGYSGSVNSVGYHDAAAVVVGSGAKEDIVFASPTFTLFSRYAKSSAARPLNTRPFAGLLLTIK